MFSLFQRFLKKHAFSAAAELPIEHAIRKHAELPIEKLFEKLHTDTLGLTEHQAKHRLRMHGANEINREGPLPWYLLLLLNFINPFNLLLTALAIIEFILKDYEAFFIISIMVAISVLIRFSQEFRSSLAIEKLRALVSLTATVLRRHDERHESEKKEIDIKHLAPGDIIFLSAGDMLAADVRLMSSKELSVSQSALTGESMPVEKSENRKINASVPLLDLPNICFSETNVVSGSATGVVFATGNKTYLGSLSKSIAKAHPPTNFDIGINNIIWLLIRFTLILVPLVLLINGFTKHDWFQSFLFALSVAVGLTPEMLPMIVTANLARGAINMSKHQMICKRLNAIQNFGAMDILCSDKTGTLTQDRIILEKHIDLSGEENEEVIDYAYLNSYYQTGLKNLLDIAVLQHKEVEEELHIAKDYHKIDEIPFDFERRRMSVVVSHESHAAQLICKGAVEEILRLCTFVKIDGEVKPLTDEYAAKARSLRKDLNDDGMRVLGVAVKELSKDLNRIYQPSDESEMTLLGFLAFLDPPKYSTAQAIANLKKHNIAIKVLTGDNEFITAKICNWVNLEPSPILLGNEIDRMTDDELKEKAEQATVFAKLTPLQKAKVIKALKSGGHVVGYLGDGINDAPALKEADIGISVDTAVDIAKESADIIMLEKSLLVLDEGAIEGRKTFCNMIKYIKMALSSNFGNVLSILGACALLPFLPMKPIQLLVQNLLYDISQIAIPFDNVDREFLKNPRKLEVRGIGKFMLFVGPISSIFDYATFALMWFYFGANSIESQSLFQTGWFVEGLLSQTLIVHMIRTAKVPFFESIASLPLLLTTFFVMCAGIAIPYTAAGAALDLTPLPLSYYPWLMLFLLGYCLMLQGVKTYFIRLFSFWL